MNTLTKKRPAPSLALEQQIRRGKAILRELKAALEDLEDRRELARQKSGMVANLGLPCAMPPKN